MKLDNKFYQLVMKTLNSKINSKAKSYFLYLKY